MEYKTKQYKIDYQYHVQSNIDYDNYLLSSSGMRTDTYIVKSFSSCDAINKLLEYCKITGRTDIHLLSCEEN